MDVNQIIELVIGNEGGYIKLDNDEQYRGILRSHSKGELEIWDIIDSYKINDVNILRNTIFNNINLDFLINKYYLNK